MNQIKLPAYEYVLSSGWAVILLFIAACKHYEWETASWFGLFLLVGYIGGIYIFRREQWKRESWQGTLQQKFRSKPTIMPFMKSFNQLTVSTRDGTINTRVSHAIYNSAQIGEYLVKEPGQRNVVIYDAPAPQSQS